MGDPEDYSIAREGGLGEGGGCGGLGAILGSSRSSLGLKNIDFPSVVQ